MRAPDNALNGYGLTLEPLTVDDVTPRYIAWLNDPEVTAFTELRHTRHSLAEVQKYIIKTCSSPVDVMWKILVDGEGHVGNIRLSAINNTHKRARVALLIGEKTVWGRGVGKSAIDAIAQYAFESLGLHKLTAGIYATNMASRRAFEKAGFQLEATLKDEASVNGSFMDVWLLTRFAPR